MISHVFLNLDGKSKVILNNTGGVREEISDFKGLLGNRGGGEANHLKFTIHTLSLKLRAFSGKIAPDPSYLKTALRLLVLFRALPFRF
jgi:hypothetical protein